MDLTNATDPEIMARLGTRLRALRRSCSLSMVEVAERTGLSRKTVARAEAGDNPTLATLIQLLRAYGRVGALDDFIPETVISPMDLLRQAKKSRG